MARETASKLGVCCVFTETIVSPGRSAIAWAGVPFSTCLTVVFRSPGAPIMYAMNGSAIATRMFAPGPAKITAMRFHVRCRQYASAPRPSRSSLTHRSAARAAAGDSSASATACSSSGTCSRAAARSPVSSARWTRDAFGKMRGSSFSAGPSWTSTSDAAGRCMPGIFTYPPSGIAPMPYSIPLRRTFTSAGGKPR